MLAKNVTLPSRSRQPPRILLAAAKNTSAMMPCAIGLIRWQTGISVVGSFFRGPKGVRANAPRRSTTGPVKVFAMWFRKTGKETYAREADNWRYTSMAR